MDNFYGTLSVRITEFTVNVLRPMTPYLNWEELGEGRGVIRKERGLPTLITGNL